LRVALADFFFIKLALASVGSPRTDDADIIASIGVHNNEQFAVERFAHRDGTAALLLSDQDRES
jgi:hypothetical protein